MAKPAILLGAGASIDAGLPNTFDLTKDVYDRLRQRDRSSALLFGFVISKLLVRNTRRGGTPFDKVNIEEAYDALKRLLNRNDDLLGEFVSSWEPILPAPKKRASSFDIESNLKGAIAAQLGYRGQPEISIDQDRLRRGLEALLGLANTEEYRPDEILRGYLDVLCKVLSPDDPNIDYLCQFFSETTGELSCIATLNYDTLVENALNSLGIKFDYGLGNWNDKRLVKFGTSSAKLIKLHGSVNWHTIDREEIWLDANRLNPSHRQRAMIFGGQSEKLTPLGPFLNLRHEFQRTLDRTNVLAVVGYSFSDDHLNAMIRSWLAVKRRAKFIVLNPDGLDGAKRLGRRYGFAGRQGPSSPSVEFVEIRQTFENGVGDLIDALRQPPRLPSVTTKPATANSSQKRAEKRKAA